MLLGANQHSLANLHLHKRSHQRSAEHSKPMLTLDQRVLYRLPGANDHTMTSFHRFISGPGTLEPRRSGGPPAARFRLRAAPLCAALPGLERGRRPQPTPLATPRGWSRAVLLVAHDDAPEFRGCPDLRGRPHGPHRSFVQRHRRHHAHVLRTGNASIGFSVMANC